MRSSLMEPDSAPNTHSYRSQPVNHFQSASPSSASSEPPKRRFALAPDEGWLPLLLLTIAVYSVVYSVTSAININHNEILWLTTAMGLVLGLGIAKVRHFPQTILHIGSCIFGYWLALFLTSTLAYHTSILYLLAELRSVLTGDLSLAGTPNSDMIFLFYLAFLCFFLGYFGSWLIYRAHLPWLVALVYISIMVVNLNYVSGKDLTFLVVILAATLILLIARIQLAGQLTQWRSEGLYTDGLWLRNMTNRFVCIATLFVLLIVPLSSALPVLSQPAAGANLWTNLDNAWSNITHGHLPPLSNPSDLFASYQPSTNFFGDQLSITGSVDLPTGPVLSYTTSRSSRGAYLEGFTFDTFDGHTWTTRNSGTSQSYRANSQLQPDVPPNGQQNYTLLTTSVTMIQAPGGTKHYIFGPAQPIDFTVPVTIYSDNASNVATAWAQSNSFGQHEPYEVISAVSNASSTDLSAIGMPDVDSGTWESDPNIPTLLQHYLQLPGTISPQVQMTAFNWTRGSTNAYDVARALESHLSNSATFTYSIDNPPIPANVDAVTWLLQTRRGYCTYYATAMTIMARQLGLPARLVNGFSAGHYDAQKKIWQVDGNDAHSWVQIYFPNFGWINFDPTPGFSQGQSSNSVAPTPKATPSPAVSSPTATPSSKPKAQPTLPSTNHPGKSASITSSFGGPAFLLVTILLILLVAATGLSVVFYRARRFTGPPAASVYNRLCRFADRLGSPPDLWQTPYEYLFALSKRFPRATNELHKLADLFVLERWAPQSQAPTPVQQQQALKGLWPFLRNAMLRSIFFRGR